MTANEIVKRLIWTWMQRDDEGLDTARRDLAALDETERDDLLCHAQEQARVWRQGPEHEQGGAAIWEWLVREIQRAAGG